MIKQNEQNFSNDALKHPFFRITRMDASLMSLAVHLARSYGQNKNKTAPAASEFLI